MSEILRLVAGGLLALIACYIGILVKRRYNRRVEFFKSACEFATFISTELAMKKTPMPDISARFLQGRAGEFERSVENWSEIAKKGKCYEFENVNVSILKTDEKKQLVSFFSTLGKTDLKDQLAHVGYFKNVFEQKQKTCEEESKKLGNMYFKLCVLAGIAIMLILA